MKLITLGTGHGDPNSLRCHSANLLECGGKIYMLDAGDSALTGLIRAGFKASELTALFISHLHDDHASGIPAVIKNALKYRDEAPENHLTVFLPQRGTAEILKQWIGVFLGNMSLSEERLAETEYREYGAGVFYDDGTLRVTAIRTGHIKPGSEGCPRSYAWLIEGDGCRVVFTGDLSSDFSDFPAVAIEKYCDAVICELTHFNIGCCKPILDKLPCGRLIFTHVYDPWDTESGREAIAELQSHLKYPVEVAGDGMVFMIKGER